MLRTQTSITSAFGRVRVIDPFSVLLSPYGAVPPAAGRVDQGPVVPLRLYSAPVTKLSRSVNVALIVNGVLTATGFGLMVKFEIAGGVVS